MKNYFLLLIAFFVGATSVQMPVELQKFNFSSLNLLTSHPQMYQECIQSIAEELQELKVVNDHFLHLLLLQTDDECKATLKGWDQIKAMEEKAKSMLAWKVPDYSPKVVEVLTSMSIISTLTKAEK